MAHETHLSGGAKDAAHGAASLGADAGGSPSFKGHEDGFNCLVILKMQEKFTCEAVTAVGGDSYGQDIEIGFGLELGQDFRAQSFYFVDTGHLLLVERMPEPGGVKVAVAPG